MPISRRGLMTGAVVTGLGATALDNARATTSPSATSRFALATERAGKLREYWIQVDSFRHNLVPTGYDGMMGMRFKPSESSMWALGYRAYSPGWKKALPGSAHIGPNTGIPGPIIRAEVGDTVRVHFRNNDNHYRFPHSIHTHGFKYAVDSDGGYLSDQPHVPGRAVHFGHTYTYEWTAVTSSVGTWPYHDHATQQGLTKAGPVMELNAQLGMFGMVAVTGPLTAKVDKEFFLFFHDLYAEDVPSLSQDYDCFNGHAYLGNTPTFQARAGEKVRWRIAALGKEFHVFHVHGHRWVSGDRFVDSQIIGPSTTLDVEYTEDNPGDWVYHCHVTDHMAGGMVGRYLVHPRA
jgi:FtsP/CotA-like multicopper oxidase with cupredoxin domain